MELRFIDFLFSSDVFVFASLAMLFLEIVIAVALIVLIRTVSNYSDQLLDFKRKLDSIE